MVDVTADFLARREPRPPGPPFAESMWFVTGVAGREVSGVGTGVASVEVVSLYDDLGWAIQNERVRHQVQDHVEDRQTFEEAWYRRRFVRSNSGA